MLSFWKGMHHGLPILIGQVARPTWNFFFNFFYLRVWLCQTILCEEGDRDGDLLLFCLLRGGGISGGARRWWGSSLCWARWWIESWFEGEKDHRFPVFSAREEGPEPGRCYPLQGMWIPAKKENSRHKILLVGWKKQSWNYQISVDRWLEEDGFLSDRKSSSSSSSSLILHFCFLNKLNVSLEALHDLDSLKLNFMISIEGLWRRRRWTVLWGLRWPWEKWSYYQQACQRPTTSLDTPRTQFPPTSQGRSWQRLHGQQQHKLLGRKTQAALVGRDTRWVERDLCQCLQGHGRRADAQARFGLHIQWNYIGVHHKAGVINKNSLLTYKLWNSNS